MVLDANIIRMSIEFKDFTTLSTLILSNEFQTCSFDLFNKIWIDFVTMSMALVDGVVSTVESLCDTIIDLEDGWS